MNIEVYVSGPDRNAYAYTGGKPWPAGEAPERCVVFVHGALNDHSVWTLLARWYANHGYAVLAVDQPGHGRSDGPPLANVEALADWLLALLDAAGVGRAHFVGHSMGSLIALEAAARAPERAAGLVMVGTAYPMKVSPALLDTARDDPARAIAMVNVFSHSGIAAKPSYPGPGAWLHGASTALMERMQDIGHADGNLFEHDFRVCDAYGRGLEAAAAVRCPVHLIVGERDVMTPARATKELAQALKATVLRVKAGHALMQEAPDAVLNAMRQAIPA
jgi:pimeloyl-ACP methyl ester carboxylesterase